MLRIERVQMQLPAGFEHRASAISRLIGENMAQIHISKNRTLDRLSISPLRISQNATDQEIAHIVVEQIASSLDKEI